MFSPFERLVAGRYLRARRREGFISVVAWFSLVGIALGVATLIIVLSVMNGFRQELVERILGVNGHIVLHAAIPGDGMDDFDAVAAAVRTVAGVRAAYPMVEGQVLASGKGRSSGAMVHGTRPSDFMNRDLLPESIDSGSLGDFIAGEDVVVVGYRLARGLNLVPGDKIRLISPKGRQTVAGMVPRDRGYRIAATFNVGMYEYDSSFIFMPLEHAQVYFLLRDKVNQISVFTDDPENVADLVQPLTHATGGVGRIFTWQDAHAKFFNALQVERNVMFLILTLIIVVAAFNVISSLIMMVHDKGKGIAILRTMGATRGMITRIFFMTGSAVGLIGTAAGVALGLGFCLNIETIQGWVEAITGTEVFAAELYFLSNLPAVVDPDEVMVVVGISLALSFLATFYPSWRAARVDPVEALRYE